VPNVQFETPQTNLNVPGVQAPFTREFGKIGGAAEEAGAQIENSTQQLSEKLLHLQALDASSTAVAADKLAASQKMTQLKLSSPDGLVRDQSGELAKNQDGTPRTIANEFYDWSNERYQNAQANMPSGMSQRLYREHMLGYYSDQTALMGGHVQRMQVEADQQRQSLQVQKYQDDLVSNPSMENLYSYLSDVQRNNNSRVGLVYNATEAQAQTQKAYEMLSGSMMKGVAEGVLDQKKMGDPKTYMQGIRNWLDVIDGKDKLSADRRTAGLPVVADIMDPTQKAAIRNHLISLQANASAQDRQDGDMKFANVVAAAKDGRADPGSLSWAQKYVMDGVASNQMHGAEGAQKMGTLAAAQEIGKVPDTFDALPLASRQAYMAQAEQRAIAVTQSYAKQFGVGPDQASGTLAYQAHAAILTTLQGQIDQAEAAKNKDYAKFSQGLTGPGKKLANVDFGSPLIAKSAETIQAAARMQDAMAKVNPPSDSTNDRGPLTREQSNMIASKLKDPNGMSSDAAAKYLEAVKTGYGPYANRAIEGMISYNDLPPSWRLLETAPNSQDLNKQRAMITAIRGGKELDATFKDLFEKSNVGVNETSVRNAVVNAFQPYIKTQAMARPGDVSQDLLSGSLVQAGSNYAKQLLIDNPGMDPKSAAKTAYQHMVGEDINVSSVGSGWFSKGSLYAVPKVWNGRTLGPADMANIDSNLKDNQDHLESHNLQPDLGMGNQAVNDHWLQRVKDNGAWTFDPSKNGFIYRYYLPHTDGTVDGPGTVMTKEPNGRVSPLVIPLDNALMVHPQGRNQ
jgi:hypothetical protein